MFSFTADTSIDAPPERVWTVLADVSRWPEWLPTVSAVEPLDAPPLTLGARYRVLQPKLRPAIWTVTLLEPGQRFAWESQSPGMRAIGDHRVAPSPSGGTDVVLRVDFQGPVAFLAKLLAGGLTQDYVAREARALKERVEAGEAGAS